MFFFREFLHKFFWEFVQGLFRDFFLKLSRKFFQKFLLDLFFFWKCLRENLKSFWWNLYSFCLKMFLPKLQIIIPEYMWNFVNMYVHQFFREFLLKCVLKCLHILFPSEYQGKFFQALKDSSRFCFGRFFKSLKVLCNCLREHLNSSLGMCTVLYTRIYSGIRQKVTPEIAKNPPRFHARKLLWKFFRFFFLKFNHGRSFLRKSMKFSQTVLSFGIILEILLGFLTIFFRSSFENISKICFGNFFSSTYIDFFGVISQSPPSIVSKILQTRIWGTF